MYLDEFQTARVGLKEQNGTYVRTYSVMYPTYYVHTVRISTRVLRDQPRERGFPGVKNDPHACWTPARCSPNMTHACPRLACACV